MLHDELSEEHKNMSNDELIKYIDDSIMEYKELSENRRHLMKFERDLFIKFSGIIYHINRNRNVIACGERKYFGDIPFKVISDDSNALAIVEKYTDDEYKIVGTVNEIGNIISNNTKKLALVVDKMIPVMKEHVLYFVRDLIEKYPEKFDIENMKQDILINNAGYISSLYKAVRKRMYETVAGIFKNENLVLYRRLTLISRFREMNIIKYDRCPFHDFVYYALVRIYPVL